MTEESKSVTTTDTHSSDGSDKTDFVKTFVADLPDQYYNLLTDLGFTSSDALLGYTPEKFFSIIETKCKQEGKRFKEKYHFEWKYGDLGVLAKELEYYRTLFDQFDDGL